MGNDRYELLVKRETIKNAIDRYEKEHGPGSSNDQLYADLQLIDLKLEDFE